MEKINFGTDGIRGIINETLSISNVKKICSSICFFAKKNNLKTIYIASDNRISKDILLLNISSLFVENGFEVIYLNIMSTPCFMYYTYLHSCLGIMLTASHNHYLENGLKIIYKGNKISEKEEEYIIANLNRKYINYSYCNYGKFIYDKRVNKEYLNYVNKYINKTNLKVMFDLAHGATYKYVKRLKNKISNNIKLFNQEGNGKKINYKCGATNIDFLKNKIKKYNYDLGFSFDGDGDRLIGVLNNGIVLDGDSLAYIFYILYLKENKIKNKGVVLTKNANFGILKAFKRLKAKVYLVDIGDKNVLNKLIEKDLLIGAETSGHLILKDIFLTGDGLLNSLYLLNLLNKYKIDINSLLANIDFASSYQVSFSCKDSILLKKEISKIQEELKLAKYEYVFNFRKSGTENLYRLFFMNENKDEFSSYQKRIVTAVELLSRS